jgi:hypothetical protein
MRQLVDHRFGDVAVEWPVLLGVLFEAIKPQSPYLSDSISFFELICSPLQD